jgi:hypothetical protein
MLVVFFLLGDNKMNYNGFYIQQVTLDYYKIYRGDSINNNFYITGVDSYRDACMMINFYNQARTVLGW